MSQSGLSAPASPDPDVMSGTSSRPESRSSISSSSMVDQAAESSRFSSNLDEVDKKSESGEVIGLDENAQSGGLLDEHKKGMMLDSPDKGQEEDSLEMVSDDDMEANESCRDHVSRKSPINIDPLKDTELDFEGDVDEDSKRVAEESKKSEGDDEDGECGDPAQTEKDGDEEEKEEGEELEEGEVSSEEDVGKHARMEPRPVCRFYSKGNCTWGSNCRFVHPGVLDKGNYNMFAPARSNTTHASGLPYERSYDRPVPPPAAGLAPPAGEWGNSSSRSAPPRAAVRHTQAPETQAEAAGGAESAWERGLRQAKEMLKKSSQRKETDIDFEEKKLNLGLGEEDLDKENDYYTRPASPIQHGDVPPPFEELEPEPYSKYPQPPVEGRWPPPPSRYPPPPYPSHHTSKGYPPYPYPESRRGFPDPGIRDREYYKSEGYDRPYYGYKPSERDAYASSGKPPLPPPPPTEKRWQEERYVEVVQAPAQRGRSDEWWDPWMRPRSPSGTAVTGGNASAGKSAGGGGGGGGGGGTGRRRSYSSGSSYSSSSSTSSSSSSSYSSSSRSSSRSSASSRSSSRSKSPMASKRRSTKKPKLSERTSKSSKTQSVSVPKQAKQAPPSSSSTMPLTSPPKLIAAKKPSQGLEKQRSALDRSPNRNREGWSSSSRSRSRSPSMKTRPPPKNSSSLPVKTHGRPRSSSGSSSSSDDWDSSSRSSGEGRSRRTNRGRRDFAERKELRGGNTPPLPPPPTAKGKMVEPAKVVETKQQIKLTLKSAAPTLKKVSNKFNDDSDEDGGSRDWEKEKTAVIASPPTVGTNVQPSRKRSAESPPPVAPPSKIAAVSTAPKGEKGSKKSTATRREELLKQLKAVEDAIARKRSKLTT